MHQCYKKDEYTAVPYVVLFQDESCEICKRVHSVDRYISVHTNVF